VSDLKKLRRTRADLDAYADEHTEGETTDAAIRALCERAGVDPEDFQIIAGETAATYVRAMPVLLATSTAFTQAFFMGIEWEKQQRKDSSEPTK